jgi:hypothetical protein
MKFSLDNQLDLLGSGMIGPYDNKFLLTIPKNASSFLSSWTISYGWQNGNLYNFSPSEVYVVIRDPIDRWISGISQYIKTYILSPVGPNGPIFPGDVVTDHDRKLSVQEFIRDYNPWVDRLIFDVISLFDHHTFSQSFFCSAIQNTPCCYVRLDSTFQKKLIDLLRLGLPNTENFNRGEDDEELNDLQNFFTDLLDKRSELRKRLVRHYSADYDLYNKAI